MNQMGRAVFRPPFWRIMQYKVKVSFASTEIGGHAADEIITLTPEQAKGLVEAGYIEVVPASQVIQTADLQVDVETADIKVKRKK